MTRCAALRHLLLHPHRPAAHAHVQIVCTGHRPRDAERTTLDEHRVSASGGKPTCPQRGGSDERHPCEPRHSDVLSMQSNQIKHALSMHSDALRCTQHALSMHSACTQHALSMHSARTQHALSMHSACTQHALSMHSAYLRDLDPRPMAADVAAWRPHHHRSRQQRHCSRRRCHSPGSRGLPSARPPLLPPPASCPP